MGGSPLLRGGGLGVSTGFDTFSAITAVAAEVNADKAPDSVLSRLTSSTGVKRQREHFISSNNVQNGVIWSDDRINIANISDNANNDAGSHGPEKEGDPH